jgi:LDH2 family malate/lactate/ureidoglycolate dehydrogenase
MDGALLSFDKSYKGSGFAMVAEVLAGPLVGGAWVDNQTFKEEWGTCIMAIDPDLLVDRDVFKANVSDMLDKIRSAHTRPGEVIRLPGEKARELYDRAMASGEVEIDDAIIAGVLVL